MLPMAVTCTLPATFPFSITLKRPSVKFCSSCCVEERSNIGCNARCSSDSNRGAALRNTQWGGDLLLVGTFWCNSLGWYSSYVSYPSHKIHIHYLRWRSRMFILQIAFSERFTITRLFTICDIGIRTLFYNLPHFHWLLSQ